jgi:hypothetical protein
MITTTHVNPSLLPATRTTLGGRLMFCGRCSQVLGAAGDERTSLELLMKHTCQDSPNPRQPSIAVPFS